MGNEHNTSGATLADIMNALQMIGEAVTTDNRDLYTAWVKHARKIGVTDHQIRDSYAYRARKRLAETSLPPLSFDWDGNPY